MHKCAFTSGESVGSGVASADCRARAGENVIVRCKRCLPSKNVYRCSCCYQKYSSTIQKRCVDIEKHSGGQVRREPAIDALFRIDWNMLASGGYEHPALEQIAPGEFEWKIPCPSCYDFKVGAVDSMVPAEFPDVEPRIVSDEIVELSTEHTDHVTGLVPDKTRSVSLRVVSVDQALTREQERKLFFRAADPPEHDKYRVFWRPHDADAEAERWLLVRSTGWGGEEPKALSLIRWNALRGCAERTSDHELGAALLDCVRAAAGFHKRLKREDGAKEESAAQSNKSRRT